MERPVVKTTGLFIVRLSKCRRIRENAVGFLEHRSIVEP